MLEGAQYVKQIALQPKTICFRSSNDYSELPELPENYYVGQAIGGGDCFFDSVAKGLQHLNLEVEFTVKSLRQVCSKFAQSQLGKDQSWLEKALQNETENINEYIQRIEFTANDIDIAQEYDSVNVLGLTSPIWGRSEIEGRIICKEYNVKLHIVEKQVVPKELWVNQIVNSEGSKSVNDIDYNEENTIHIMNRGNAHFEPILKKRSSDIMPEEELINTVKSSDSQETSSKKRPHNDEENAFQCKKKKLSTSSHSQPSSDKQENRKPTGLLTSYHGVAYQVQWMMVVALEAQDRLNVEESGGFKFSTIDFKTEDPDAGKFDDLVWRYETDQSGSYEYNFLQAKHKLNKEEKITARDLLKSKQKEDSSSSNKTDNRPFALEKYFLSYRDEIKKNYNAGKINKLIIATNIDLDNDLKQSSFVPLEINIPILDFIEEEPDSWRFRDDCRIKKELSTQLESKYDSIKLVEELLENILKKEPVTEESPLGSYFYDLIENDIIDVSGKFHPNFIGNNERLPEKGKRFREFVFELGLKNKKQNPSKERLSEKSFWEAMRSFDKFKIDHDKIEMISLAKDHKSLSSEGIILEGNKFNDDFKEGKEDNLSEKAKRFREFLLKLGFKNTSNKFDISEPFDFAKEFESLIKKSDDIKIERRKEIIKKNIDKLANYVLVEDEENIIRFSRVFWEEDDAKLLGNLKDFRSQLKANFLKSKLIDENDNSSQIYEKLRKYHFTIKGKNKDTKKEFTTCKERLISKKAFWQAMENGDIESNINEILPFNKNLPEKSLNDIKDEIEGFFERFIFVVNYSQETLDKFIKEKCSWFVGFKTDYIAYEFQAKIGNVLNWQANKKDFISTAEDVEMFFEQAKNKLNSLVLIGPTLLYKAQIEEYGIKFQEGCIKELFEYKNIKDNQRSYNFFNSEKSILSLVTEQNDLTSIKAYQAIGQYKKEGEYIFMDLSSILKIKEQVLSAFEERDLLIIECDYTSKNVHKLYSSLRSKLSGNKKIILISQENHPLPAKFKDDFSGYNKYKERKDERNILTDLTPESQAQSLERGRVIFQEEEVSLGILVDDGSKDLIGGIVLSKLINNMEIRIGKALTDSKYDDVKNYYIDRTFNRQVKIKNDLDDEKFLLTDSDKVNKDSKKDQDIVLISNTGKGFQGLCDNHKEHNIHWLKKKQNDLIWQQSYGALSKLRDFIDTNEQAIEEYKPEKITDIADRVVIIAAEPGMGKSTVLTPLALKTKESNPCLWVVRINLLDYSSELKNETEKETKLNEEEAIRFLYRIVGFQLFQEEKKGTTEKKEQRKQTIKHVLSAITVKDSKIIMDRKIAQDLDLLEIELFNFFYNQGRINLLFDGFDEISPNYEMKAIELLEILKNTKVKKLLITTRPYNFVQERLEDQLNTFSYSLKPLSPKQQKHLLRKFWKAKLKLSELDEQRSGVFINGLLDKLPQSIGDQDFLSIPLHAFMVAEVFKDAFKSFYDSNEQELSDEHKREIKEQDLATLYERFINKKFDEIRFGEKKPGTNTADVDMIAIIEKEREEFIEDHKKLALYALFNQKEVKKLLSQQEMRKVSKLIDRIKLGQEKNGIIERIIDNKPKFVHLTFAEYFVASYFWEFFKSVQLNKFEEFINMIRNLIKNDMIQISKFLQLKTKKNLERNIDFRDKLSILIKELLDQTRNYGPNDENKQSTKLLFGIIEFASLTKEGIYLDRITDIDKLKLLCVSAEMGYIKLANALETELNTEFLRGHLRYNKWFYSPLWLAAKNAHLDLLQILVKQFSYDPIFKDKDSLTLVERIFQKNDFDVLRPCLKLGIVDAKPYKHSNEQKLPILEALNSHAPSDVIKLLIEKTDSGIVNKFENFNTSNALDFIGISLLKYDKEITELAIKKGFDFSQVINLLLFEFSVEGLERDTNRLKFGFYSTPSFHSDKEFLILFERIELLLKSGVGYNSKDTKYGQTTLQYAERIHYIHKLLEGVHKLHNQENDKSSNPLDTIRKLIIGNMITSSDFRSFEITIDSEEKISLLLETYDKSTFLPLYNIPKLPFKSDEISNTNLAENTLDKLSSYISKAREQLERFKEYPDSKIYNDILTGYEEMLEYSITNNGMLQYAYSGPKNELQYAFREKIKLQYNSYKTLNKCVKGLLAWVLNLYIRQDYKIDDALKEVKEKVLEFKKIINRLKENSGHTKLETLEILDMKSIDTNEELQDLMLKIYKCRGIELLIKSLKNFDVIGQKRIMGILELMFKFADQSLKIFELLKKLDSSYKSLTKAVENKNYQDTNNVLQNIEPDFRKAIINGQDYEYGSPLHYAAFQGDVETIEILLNFGANPNLRLQQNGILFRNEEQSEDYYDGCTPLHLGADNGHKNVVEILLEKGADINGINEYGLTPLHFAAEDGKLEIIKQLLDNGADPTIQIYSGETPLKLAENRINLYRKKDRKKEIYQKIIDILKSKSINRQQETDSN